MNHALCAALQELLQEFATKVSQLEQALHKGHLEKSIQILYHPISRRT